MSPASFSAISPHETHARWVVFAGNTIGDAGAIQLASAMLALSQLHTLDLSRTVQITLAALSAAVAPHASRLCCCTQGTRLEPKAVLPLLRLLHPVSSCKL